MDFDVTECMARFEEIELTQGIKPSLVAYLAWCLGKTMKEHPRVNGIPMGSRKIFYFDDVDVVTYVERDVDGEKVLGTHIIRAAHNKSIVEMTREIREVQSTGTPPPSAEGKGAPLMRIMESLIMRSNPASRWLWRRAVRNPILRAKIDGTVVLSSMGMHGKGASFYPKTVSAAPVALFVGSMSKEPRAIDNEVRVRTVLRATLAVNHIVSDGSPMARFAATLTQYVEQGPSTIDMW